MYVVGVGLVTAYKALLRLASEAPSVLLAASMSEASLSFVTLIKLCYTKALKWSSLVPGPEAKSSLEITNLTLFTVSYQHLCVLHRKSWAFSPWMRWNGRPPLEFFLHLPSFSFPAFKHLLGFPGGSVDKESACNAGDLGLIPELGRSPGEGNGNPLKYSCLENPMDRGFWKATVHGVARVRYDWATVGPALSAFYNVSLRWAFPGVEGESDINSTRFHWNLDSSNP